MNAEHELTLQQEVKLARLQAWAMSFVCGFLTVCAVAAATRIPHYLAVSDYARLTGVVLFGLLVLAGIIDNVRLHICLRRLKNRIA